MHQCVCACFTNIARFASHTLKLSANRRTSVVNAVVRLRQSFATSHRENIAFVRIVAVVQIVAVVEVIETAVSPCRLASSYDDQSRADQ